MSKKIYASVVFLVLTFAAFSQGTRLLRQPTINGNKVAFEYGCDIWVTDLDNGQTKRITNTGAVESNPYFSPDGKTIAFTSNRSGTASVYIVPVEGGIPTRLTWYPSSATVWGWTPDGERVLYSTARETAPVGHGRLWTVSKKGGPSKLLAEQWGFSGSFSPDGKKIAIDKVSRWDVEWREYRGGQNTPLIILDLKNWSEELIPNEKTMDTKPLWLGKMSIFFPTVTGLPTSGVIPQKQKS